MNERTNERTNEQWLFCLLQFFCFLGTILFAFDAVLMAQIVREKHKQSFPDDEVDEEDEDEDGGDSRDARDARDARDNRRGQRNGGRGDHDRRNPRGRQNRGYDERY